MKTNTTSFFGFLLGTFLSASSVQAQSLQWAKSFYGQGCAGTNMTIDASGNVLTTGNFFGVTDFDPSAATVSLTPSVNGDFYVSKLDAAGNYIWAKQIGSAGASSIKTDAAGNVFVTGSFQGTTDLDPGAGTFPVTSVGIQDIFLLKLDPNGNFIWGAAMGSNNNDYGNAIALDAASNAYVVGTYSSTVDFDPGVGVSNLTSPSGASSFILKLDNTGNFIWAKTFQGGTNAIAIDAAGIYMTGSYNGTVDFDPGAGVFNATSNGGSDVFISKLDASGNFVWAKTIGAPVLGDGGNDIVVDATGNVIVAGTFIGSQMDFDPGAGTYTMATVGAQDVFVLKLDNGGNFMWAKSWGGVNQDDTRDLVLDAAGNIFTSGYYSNVCDFDPGAGSYTLTTAPISIPDGFLTKLDASGNFVWAAKFGASSYDFVNGIANDAAGDIYMTGQFVGTVDFDPGAGVSNLASPNASIGNAFIVKLGSSIITGVNDNKDFNNSVGVYPNPFSTQINFEVKENNGKETTVVIYNSIGQIVKTEKSSTDKIIIQRDNLPTGVYFYKAMQEGNLIASGKLIAE